MCLFINIIRIYARRILYINSDGRKEDNKQTQLFVIQPKQQNQLQRKKNP